MSSFVGAWTYRSFHNLPKIDKIEELLFAEAELTLDETERPDFVRGRLTFGAVYLALDGVVEENGGQKVLRMRGRGIAGTQTEGWVYDYVGVLAQPWEHAEGQRPAIVGSVVRTAPHAPKRPAGYSASFIAVNRVLPRPAQNLPDSVVAHFAARLHRLHHAVWHGIRNAWDAMPPELHKQLADLDWATPRPARAFGPDGALKGPHVANGSGEDFLFFHRQMVVSFRAMMALAGATPVQWTTIPEPGSSPGDEVPAMWPMPGERAIERRLISLKSDAYYWSCMRLWDQHFKDSNYLSTLTLAQLGSLLEFTVHNDMHMRWSAGPRDPDTRALLALGRPPSDISAKWDAPAYDWLGEFYSSHVNPFFWRLHGWVDDRIDDWFVAHDSKHPGEVRRAPKGGVDWFEPGRWVEVDSPWVWPASLGGYGGGHGGPLEHDHGGSDDLDAKRLASLERVFPVLYPPAPGGGPASPVLRRALSPIAALAS